MIQIELWWKFIAIQIGGLFFRLLTTF